MKFNDVLKAYQSFEVYELKPAQISIIKYIQYQKDPLTIFLKMIRHLHNDMYGRYILVSNTLHYQLSIKLKTRTKYEFIASSSVPYRLEVQRQDDIRYTIEPLVRFVNSIFKQLTPLQQCQFYNIYIKQIDEVNAGYIKRSLNHSLKQILQKCQ